MTPAGYMAKRISKRPDWFRAPQVEDVYSVSGCVSEAFADYIQYWKHNGYWLFDSPTIVRNVASEHSIDLEATTLFYYEAYELELSERGWRPYSPEASFPTNVEVPVDKRLEGFDVVTFSGGTSPECSPLSCNSLAKEIRTNGRCLLESFEEAERHLNGGAFHNCEPGPYRIFSVYTVDWPQT